MSESIRSGGRAAVLEHVLGVRWLLEAWFAGPSVGEVSSAYAGRMSPTTCVGFLLTGTALEALSWPGPRGASRVRYAGGAALMLSWLAVVAVSFDGARIGDTPRFPGMAALTIMLFALSSVSIVLASAQAMARLRDADAAAVLSPRLLLIAFGVPLVLGQLHLYLSRRFDTDLASAGVVLVFASVVSVALWRGAAYMQSLHRQRAALCAWLFSHHRLRRLARTGLRGAAVVLRAG